MTASLQRRLGSVSWLSGQPQGGGPAAPARVAGRAAWGDGGRGPRWAVPGGEAGNRGPAGCGPASARRALSRWSGVCGRRYPGRLDQAAPVREFLTGLLRGCPAAADVILLTDELVSNALLHSDQGRPRGGFSVRADICH